MAFITLKINNVEVARHPLNKNEVIKIGRLQENDIVIDNPAVSGRHAEIVRQEEGFIIRDVGSRNGTFFEGNPIKSRRLSEGDIITIGKHELLFSEQDLEYADADSNNDTSPALPSNTQGIDETIFLDTKQQKETLDKLDRLGQRKPLLVVKFKDKMLFKYVLKYRQTSIGRSQDNKIVIDNIAVSSRHAVIIFDGSSYTVEDLDSKNGTYVNKKQVKSCKLFNGDIITIGKHDIVYEEGGTYTYDEIAQPLQSDPMSSTDGTIVISKKEFQEVISGASGKKARPGFTFLKGGQGYIPIDKKVFKLGKNTTSDIVVKGLMVGDTAALITSKQNIFHLTYQKGFAKPTVNGSKIKGTIQLKNNDIIKIGSTELKFNS